MNDATRRGFLAMAGVGAATVGAAAAIPAGLELKAPSGSAAPQASSAHGPIVAVISDASKGEVSLLVGESEIVVQDRALVNRIAALSKKSAV